MAKRYIPNNPFSITDKKRVRRVFVPDRKGRDGTRGYTAAELKDVPKAHLASFRIEEVGGAHVIEDDEVIEAATATPGEKRTAKTKATE